MPRFPAAFGLHLRARGRLRLDAVPPAEWSWQPADPAGAALGTAPEPPNEVARTNYRPGPGRQDVVLLLEAGVLSQGLIDAMRRHGLRYFYLDFLAFMRDGMVSLRSGPGSELRVGPACLRLDDVAAVVWTQPMALVSRTSTRRAARHLLEQRWMQVLRELRGACRPRTLWFPSHPLNGSNEWQDKLRECRLAVEAGFAVPETLLTNSPDEASAFVERWHGAVVFKEFSQARLRFRTSLIAPGDPRLAQVRHSPCAFQQYVTKEYDVRAVVIGPRVFAVRIDSQASVRTRLDWRLYDNSRVRWERMRLPAAVERSMRRLMRTLDLAWASFDLVKARDGGFYFLEVNRPGASYWLGPFVGLDVPDEIGRELARRINGRRRGASR